MIFAFDNQSMKIPIIKKDKTPIIIPDIEVILISSSIDIYLINRDLCFL